MTTPAEELTNLQLKKFKLIAGLVTASVLAGGGFWGGIKYCDVKIKAQIGDYEIKIEKLQKDVNERDIKVEAALNERDAKTKDMLAAKAKAEQLRAQADTAEQAYYTLTAKLHTVETNVNKAMSGIKESGGKGIAGETSEIETPPTADDIVVVADQVIAKKDEQIQGINIALNDCFDAKAAADKAIAELQIIGTDKDQQLSLKDKINSDISKELKSQERRKWLYLIGGVIAGVAADHALKK